MQFSGAKAMAVSAVPCSGRAVVLLVSTSPCFCVLCAVFVALRAHNGQKLAFDGALGQYFRGDAAGAAALGEFFRGSAVVGSRRASLLCRVPGSRAPLLAVLTLQCAAKPYWWHGRQPAQATTYRASVRRKRPRPPPIGLTCAPVGPHSTYRVNVRIKGARARRMRSQEQKRA